LADIKFLLIKMSRLIYLDIYRVIKPIEVNSTAINQIGDIITIDEDGYDGANVDNLTQGWGFKCFGSYDSITLITKKTMTWNEYIALVQGSQEVRQRFINSL
jgi:hypothetical protein